MLTSSFNFLEDLGEKNTKVKLESEENEDARSEIDTKDTGCNVSYTNQTTLKRHNRNIYSENKIKCDICNREMAKKSLRRHMKDVHSIIIPKGDNKNVDEVILKSEVDSEDNIVETCETLCEIEMKGSVEEEKKINLGFGDIECKICNQTYSSKLNLKKHVYNVHKMVKVKCNICEKEVNKKSLDRHMKCVHNARVSEVKKKKLIPEEEKIPCGFCDKKCSSLVSLQSHIKNIHEAEQFQCKLCDFRGIRKQLEKHMKKEHNDEVYQCVLCQKKLKSKSTLREHMWIHTDHRRFICDICGMRFKRTSNYHGHLKSHQEKKFQCQLCGNFFLRKRYLAIHEQTIHNYYGEGVPPQEKGFQCEVCGIKLKWKNNLLGHMRIHTGEKPYKCKICGENFTCHGSLRTHMAKHAICSTPSDVSSIFIQKAYLDNKSELTQVPFSSTDSNGLKKK